MEFADVGSVDLSQRRVLGAARIAAVVAPFGRASCDRPDRDAAEIVGTCFELVHGEHVSHDVGILPAVESGWIVGGHGAAGAVEEVERALAAPVREEPGTHQRRRALPAGQVRSVASRAVFAIGGAAALSLRGGEGAIPWRACLGRCANREQRA